MNTRLFVVSNIEYKIFVVSNIELMNRVLFKQIENHIFSWMRDIIKATFHLYIGIKLIQNKARLHPSITKPTKGKTKIDE